MNVIKLSWLIPVAVCGSLVLAADSKPPVKKRIDPPKPRSAAVAPATPAVAAPIVPPPPPPAEVQPTARIVHYGDKDVIQLKTKVRYTTLIVLPKNEVILDFACGDKEFWIINGSQNFAYVKPAKAGTQTNLNLITASGNIYSFILNEVSEISDAVPDLKVFVEAKEQSLIGAANHAPRFVAAGEVEELRKRLAASRDDVRQQRRNTEEAVENAVHKFVGRLRFTYHFPAATKPFLVRAMFHDEKFTYIAAHPSETPTLYEIRDGQPNLIAFEFQNGVYVAQKILAKGYLAIGKHKLEFRSED